MVDTMRRAEQSPWRAAADPITAEVVRSAMEVFPGQIFDVSIPLARTPGEPVSEDAFRVESDVVDVERLAPGSPPVTSPAVVELAFSTLVLRRGDVAHAVGSGDVLVELGR